MYRIRKRKPLSIWMEIDPCEEIIGDTYNISVWLHGDVQGSGEWFLPQIEEILQSEDEEKSELFWGNALRLL